MAGLIGGVPEQVLKRGLDVAALRHQVISNNLANVDTPGFKASDVTFELSLQQALGAGATSEDVDAATPTVYRVPARAFRGDGNTVDVDWETVKLAQNTERYSSYADILRRRFAMWRLVIREGR